MNIALKPTSMSLTLALAALAAFHAYGEPAMMTIDPANAVCTNFLGFGAEWDSAGYDDAGVTDEDFAIIDARVAWMRLPLARTMMLLRWCYREDGSFDWNSRDMQLLYRQLDLCQRQGIAVILTDWGCESWTKVPGIENMVDPKYASAIGEYMDYLLNTRGYSCIKYFVLVNEPNYEVRDFDRWQQGVRMVTGEFKKRGLDERLIFAGADESNDPGWHRKAVDTMPDVLEAYDVHCYANDSMVRPGGLEDFFREHWTYAIDNDPAAKAKPFIVGEAGMNDHARHPHTNDMIDAHGYGLFMADYAVQAARAGSSAVCAWQLDDNCHPGFAWGMWYNAKNGLALRRWYYPWALLSRYVPRGSTIYRVGESDPDWRLLCSAFSAEGADKPSWTFCLVNRGDADIETTIKVPADAQVTLKHFLYNQAVCPASREGFPKPLSEDPTDLAQPIKLTCPARSMALWTSL